MKWGSGVTGTLFRREVVEAKQNSFLGSVRLATPITHQLWATVALAVTGAILAWLFFGHYTRREHVSGSLVPQAGLINVTARSAGVISRVVGSVGAEVRAGDPLVYISGERSSAKNGGYIRTNQ